MATIVVETGTGIANANSYVTLVEADQYFSDTGNPSWGGTDDQKNQNLINATAAIDATYGQRYLSYIKDNTTQALLWPRFQVWDRHGRRINNGVIPQSLKNAQIEMALLSQSSVDLYPTGNKADNVTSESVSVGEISQSFTYQRAPKDQAQYDGFRKIEQILWPILSPKMRTIRMAI